MKDQKRKTDACLQAQAQAELEEMTRRVTGMKVKTSVRAGGLQPAYGTPP